MSTTNLKESLNARQWLGGLMGTSTEAMTMQVERNCQCLEQLSLILQSGLTDGGE